MQKKTIRLLVIVAGVLSAIEAYPQESISLDPEIRRFIIQEELENDSVIEVPWFDLQISGIDTLDTAWVLPDTLSARDIGTFKIKYIPRNSGFSSNGVIIFKTPFGWQPSSKSWTYPQIDKSSLPGYVTISSSNDSSRFDLTILRNGYDFLIRAVSSSVPPRVGDTLTIAYGDASVAVNGLAFSHVNAKEYGFSVLVDKNNRSTFSEVMPEPSVTIKPRSVRNFLMTVPSLVSIGEDVMLTITALDEYNNRVYNFIGSLGLECPVTGCSVPAEIVFGESDSGRVSIGVTINDSAMHQIIATDSTGVNYHGNPIVGSGTEIPYDLYWGDLQNHTDLSDGNGSIHEFYYYARYVANLDFIAMTDHDHLIETEYLTPAVWNMVINAAEQFNDEGNFVTFLGWEWTQEHGGHRHVLLKDNIGTVYPWTSYPLPTDLWRALGETDALTIPHHVAWNMVGRAIDWTFRNDRFQNLVEIYSQHSAAEYWGNPLDFVDERSRAGGHYVRDALGMGHKLGILASSDGHFGYPGNGWMWARTALDSAARGTGLVGIYADTLTRASLYDALMAKRVYGTTDHRTIVVFKVNEAWMGETINSDQLPIITGEIYSHTPLKSAEIVKFDGKEYSIIPLTVSGNTQELSFSVRDSLYIRSSFYYLRVVSEGNLNDRFAWSSPVWVNKPLLRLSENLPALDEFGYISDGDSTHPTEAGFSFRSTSTPFSESAKLQFEVFDISDTQEAALYVNGIFLLSLPLSLEGEWSPAIAIEIPRYLVDTTNVIRFESYRNLAGNELDQWGVRNILLGSPVIKVTPSDSLHFGDVDGFIADTLNFTVMNSGTATLIITKIVDVDSFIGINPSSFILAPNESLIVDIWLNISLTDSINAVLEIYSNDPVTQKYQLLVDARIITSVEDRIKHIPAKYELSQNFPNPFNPITTIHYTIPKKGKVTLTVYNLLGEKVAILVDSEQSPAYKQATWDASKFASGIYFYRLQARDFIQTKKMVLLK